MLKMKVLANGYGSRSYLPLIPSEMPEPNSNISPYIDVLMESFKPATSNEVPTHFFSTDEIYDAIVQLNPGADISSQDVYQAMIDAGFIFKPRTGTSGIDFRWLLLQK